MIAGKADLLRQVPKKFATLISVDVENRQITAKIESEEKEQTWSINPDAELKIHGWWGRLEQFTPGDRVWIWFSLDRQKKPKAVLMLADEMSEQDIHGEPPLLKAIDPRAGTITLQPAAGEDRILKRVMGLPPANLDDGPIGQPLFVQSAGDTARMTATAEQFDEFCRQQRDWLREKWRAEGLPGFVSILHPLGGELEILLDHEGMQWGRYLKPGDKLKIDIDCGVGDDDEPPPAVDATVRHVRPWRERTQLRLVTASGVDQADLSLGARVHVHAPEPPQEVQDSELPGDIGRLTDKAERVEWFIASVYCSCSIGEDSCTGMFYSLASCNVVACGMPNTMRGRIGKMIDQGMKDEEIWRELREQAGPLLLKPHLRR